MHVLTIDFQNLTETSFFFNLKKNRQAPAEQLLRKFIFVLICVFGFTGVGQSQIREKSASKSTRLEFFKYAGSLYHAIKPERVKAQTDSFAALARSEGNQELLYQIELFWKTQVIKARQPRSYVTAFEKLEPWVEQTGSEELKATFHFLLGSYQHNEKKYADGFANMLLAIKIFEERGYEKIPEIGYYLNQLGNKYYHLGDYDKALFYLEKSEKAEPIFHRYLIDNLNTQSLCWKAKQETGKAFALVERSIQLAEKGKDSVWLGIANGNKGQLLLQNGQYREAIRCLETDYTLNKNTEPANTAFSCLYLAAAFLKTHERSRAIFYLQEAIRLSRADLPENLPRFYEFYTLYYEKLAGYHSLAGNSALAYQYLDSSRMVKDSLNRLSNAQVVSNAEQRIATQSHIDQLKLQEKENQNTLLRRNLVLIGCAGLLLLLLLALRHQRIENKKNRLIFEQKEALMLAQKRETEARLQKAETEMSDYIKILTTKNNLLEQMKAGLQEADQITNETQRKERLDELLQSSILTEEDWSRFKDLFDTLFPGYTQQIKTRVPDLSPAETRLLCLLKLKLPNKDVALMLGIAQASVNKLRYRLRRKLEAEKPPVLLEDLVGSASPTE